MDLLYSYVKSKISKKTGRRRKTEQQPRNNLHICKLDLIHQANN